MDSKYLPGRNQKKIYGESCIFIGTAGEAALCFQAEKILRVYNAVNGKEYIENVDFEFKNNRFRRLKGSSMPFFPEEDIFPDAEHAILPPEKNYNALAGGTKGRFVRFDNLDYFAKTQFEVDYEIKDFDLLPVDCQKGKLPQFCNILRNRKNLKITLIGDSISEGLNASGYHNFAPFSPPYIDWFGFGLQKKYGVKVEICNHGVNGSGCDSAFDLQDLWTADAPDLMIIAYGMNDFSRMNADEFVNILSKIRRIMKEKNPQTEFLFIASMSGNPDWERTKPGRDAEFAARLIEFVSEYPDCAVCDMYRAYGELQRRKGFFAVSGNGVNHPNDFGHRFYASILLETVEKMF